MMRVSTLEAINAAELRLVQSRQLVRVGVKRTNSALRATLARPSTLVTVALTSGIFGYMLTPRRRPSVKSATILVDSPIKASSPGLLRTLISMYGLRVLTMALELGAAAGKRSAAGVTASPPAPSATTDTSSPSALPPTRATASS